MPRLVAEALVELEDPLLAALAPGPACPVAEVTAAIAASLLPAEACAAPPAWLRPDQALSFRRGVAALQRYGGALLADPVGSGKTWVALAVAGRFGVRTVVLAPAALLPQWRDAAARSGVNVELHSHERASRGRLPRGRPALVLLDESHRFRDPGTHRYHAVAPWLMRSRVLLISATPVVNRLEDLAHQLLLAVPDDALLASGCASLRSALGQGPAPAALGELVVSRDAPAQLPGLQRRRIRTALSAADRAVLARLSALRLSRDAGIRALLRGGLIAAMASSPAALHRSLRRYQTLLGHAANAVANGRVLSRAALRAAVGPDPDQLVLWQLLPATEERLELALDDHPAVAELLALLAERAPGPDHRLRQLQALLTDGIPSLVFTGSQATLDWLRSELAALRPAWLTGAAAGIGPARLPRATVLAQFGPAATKPPADGNAPRLLLATDVAAEGLDLQRAARVVHYDLPWTAVRLTQRAGRARRLGSGHPVVETVTFLPPPEIERELGRLARLLRKGQLPARAGLDDDGRWLFRWRSDLAPLALGPRATGVAAVNGPEPGWLVSLALTQAAETGERRPARLLWIGDDGMVSDRPAEVVPRLLAVRSAPEHGLSPTEREHLPRVLAPVVRAALAAMTHDRWRSVARPREQQRLIGRLLRLTPVLARARDRAALLLVDRALASLAGGLRAGEVLLAARLRRRDDRALVAGLDGFGSAVRSAAPALPVIAGVVRVTMFPACPASAPSCSTSTGP